MAQHAIKKDTRGDSEDNLYKLIEGIRVCYYNFETSTNLDYVISDRTCGLYFSCTYSHLKVTQKMLARHANEYQKPEPANVAWGILQCLTDLNSYPTLRTLFIMYWQ